LSELYKLLRFGVFEINLDLEEVRKNGSLIKLAPQPFKLLAMLASRSGQIVTRDEIQQQLWGSDTFIDFEQGVNKCIKQIRTVLGDNADNPLYIETLPRHGYRFLAPVRMKMVPAPPPQVKEASSGLLANVAGEVRARVQGVAMPPGVPHPANIEAETLPTSESPPAPHIPARSPYWVLLAVLVVAAVLAYFFFFRH
jgi:DNA-binding winged helix-turn-helix (wHTH) protein